LFALFRKKKTVHSQLFTVALWSAVRAVSVFVLILEFSEREMSRFLDDVHIVEALNKPVDDSGSEGDVPEKEYSPCYGYYNILSTLITVFKYEGWNFNSGKYLFTTDTK